MRNIKLKLEYDGTDFFGWQIQPEGRTVQKTLGEAIQRLTGESNIEVIGSSRTDSGVHARGYVCNFRTTSKIPGERFKEAINTKLPKDIIVLNSEEVDINFHSRYMTTGKTYCYTILNRREMCVIGRQYMYHHREKLCVDTMNEACKYFLGKHDFEGFRSPGSSVKTSTRTVKELYVKRDGDFIRVYISADGFLYNMVRIITGTLLKVGMHKMKPDEIPEIILSKDRNRAGKCAPARGLCLEKVFYEN